MIARGGGTIAETVVQFQSQLPSQLSTWEVRFEQRANGGGAIYAQLTNAGFVGVSANITTARKPSVKYGSPVRL